MYRIFAENIFAMENFVKICENLWRWWLLRNLLDKKPSYLFAKKKIKSYILTVLAIVPEARNFLSFKYPGFLDIASPSISAALASP